jgi:hypothetical protein
MSSEVIFWSSGLFCNLVAMWSRNTLPPLPGFCVAIGVDTDTALQCWYLFTIES